ncbi:LD-transpeptidase YcfS [Salmonella enterica subsp. arizonae]|uniref:LD-transpeptidase YcfS n=1 Tax=Salmonella enterica subsp. arizonae TaxID=59203 RepID=A0A379SZI3_SALER|nr:LD-transpeptidase YcfS [Salmonella enterica subsp. arizonae]
MFKNTRLSRWWALLALTATIMLALPAQANTWPLPPPGSRLVGENKFHVVEDDGGSLEAIAKKYKRGFFGPVTGQPWH